MKTTLIRLIAAVCLVFCMIDNYGYAKIDKYKDDKVTRRAISFWL